MAEITTTPKWNLHPIRLQFLHLRKLRFEAYEIPERMTSESIQNAGAGMWSVNVRGSVQGNAAVVVASVGCCFARPKAEGKAQESPDKAQCDAQQPRVGPYSFEVEAVAGFAFDPKEISPEEVDRWCKKGSFYIISPYLRHVIAEVTRDSGFPEVYLPLLEVPTFAPPMKKPEEPGGALDSTKSPEPAVRPGKSDEPPRLP